MDGVDLVVRHMDGGEVVVVAEQARLQGDEDVVRDVQALQADWERARSKPPQSGKL